MINLVIDGKNISLEKRMTVLDAAKANDIHIPHFCDHPMLEKFGGCRLCLVEVEKMNKPQASCTLIASDGMVVRTNTPDIIRARKAMLEFILINHPLDCGHCDKAGECDLQDLTVKYGPAAGRFEETKWKETESTADPLIVRNMERCIMCTKCVRMCDGVQGASAISVVGRGKNSYIEPFSGNKFDCDYCGSCVTVCPVGALMSSLHRFDYRPWETTRRVPNVCPHCGVGCKTVVQVRGEDIQRAMPTFGLGINRGVMCSRGYFGWDFVDNPDRLTLPLIRKGGKLRQASWEEAYDYIAEKMLDIINRHGGSSVAGIASSYCSIEDNYIFQKVMRTAFNTNNIDSMARMGFAGARRLLEDLLGPGCTANLISGIPNSGAVLVIGSDPTVHNPVLGVRIRNAYHAGKPVITIGTMPGLRVHASIIIPSGIHGETQSAEALLATILKVRPLPKGRELLELALGSAGDFSTEMDNGVIQEAARTLLSSKGTSVVIGGDLMAHPAGGARGILIAALLAHVLDAQVYLMSEGANDNGLLDMGCEPDLLPGGLHIEDKKARKALEDIWGAPISMNKGKSLMEFMEDAHAGGLKALYVMGANPAFGLPDSSRFTQALSRLELLVVQDIFLTETAELAHVVLPSTAWPQKTGTFVNTERRLQVTRTAIQHKGHADWKMLQEIGNRMGMKLKYGSEDDILSEIAGISSLYTDLNHAEIEKGFDLWPYKGRPAASTQSPRRVDFSHFPLTRAREVFIMLDRPLHMKGMAGRHSKALLRVYPEAKARLHPSTASRFSLDEGDKVRISTEAGKLVLRVCLDGDLPANTVFLSNSFKGNGIFSLLSYNREPFSGAPVLTHMEAKIEKVG